MNHPFYDDFKEIDKNNTLILIFKNEKGYFFSKKGIKEIKESTEFNPKIVYGKGYSNGALIDPTTKTIYYWVDVW